MVAYYNMKNCRVEALSNQAGVLAQGHTWAGKGMVCAAEDPHHQVVLLHVWQLKGGSSNFSCLTRQVGPHPRFVAATFALHDCHGLLQGQALFGIRPAAATAGCCQ